VGCGIASKQKSLHRKKKRNHVRNKKRCEERERLQLRKIHMQETKAKSDRKKDSKSPKIIESTSERT